MPASKPVTLTKWWHVDAIILGMGAAVEGHVQGGDVSFQVDKDRNRSNIAVVLFFIRGLLERSIGTAKAVPWRF